MVRLKLSRNSLIFTDVNLSDIIHNEVRSELKTRNGREKKFDVFWKGIVTEVSKNTHLCSFRGYG